MKSYLTGRIQSVAIDEKMSAPIALEYGLVQGSILAPLLYILFTCDVPDLAHTHPVSICESRREDCDGSCGDTVAFIDDCTYSIAKRNPKELSESLSSQYVEISKYMSSNRLVLNDDKTHVVVFCKKALKEERKEVEIEAGDHVIKPSETEKLLGVNLSQDLGWNEHLIDKKLLRRQLHSRVNGTAW